jgi:PAS domain S-box-containing protein
MERKNILIVEDERIVALDIKKRVEDLGYTVPHMAATGVDAVHKAEEAPPDLILMDIKLKGDMDGIEAAERIRQKSQIPVVYLTAYADNSTLHRAKATEPFGYLTKPFQDRELQAAIEIALYKNRAEIELRKSEKRLKDLAEFLPEALFETDSEGCLTFANHRTLDYFGYTEQELDAGLNCLQMLAPEDRERFKEAFQKVLRGENIGIGEYLALKNDGKPFPVLLNLTSILNSEGLPLGLRGLAIDISEKKQLENQLLRAQKLESIGTIASGVAHNFRNIMAVILTNIELIKMQYDDHLELMKMLNRADSAVKKGIDLVKNLMQYCRQDKSRTYKLIDLNQLVKEAFEILRSSFDKKLILETDIPKNLTVLGSPSALSQVIMNICINARDAMADGGKLCIKAKETKGFIKLSISDTGHGMDKETATRCFDPFFTTKDADQGTGLGLSTSEAIIRNHNGFITCYSEPRRGTTFRIYLPASSGQIENEQNIDSDHIRGNGGKILIVDDEPDIRSALKELLAKMNYSTADAKDANEAIEKYKSWSPDVVLMDRNMPLVDGTECAQKITKLNPSAKIVLISGYDDSEEHELDSNVRDIIAGYLTKPIDVVELGQALNSLFT